jgi:hypothetical protein
MGRCSPFEYFVVGRCPSPRISPCKIFSRPRPSVAHLPTSHQRSSKIFLATRYKKPGISCRLQTSALANPSVKAREPEQAALVSKLLPIIPRKNLAPRAAPRSVRLCGDKKNPTSCRNLVSSSNFGMKSSLFCEHANTRTRFESRSSQQRSADEDTMSGAWGCFRLARGFVRFFNSSRHQSAALFWN